MQAYNSTGYRPTRHGVEILPDCPVDETSRQAECYVFELNVLEVD